MIESSLGRANGGEVIPTFDMGSMNDSAGFCRDENLQRLNPIVRLFHVGLDEP